MVTSKGHKGHINALSWTPRSGTSDLFTIVVDHVCHFSSCALHTAIASTVHVYEVTASLSFSRWSSCVCVHSAFVFMVTEHTRFYNPKLQGEISKTVFVLGLACPLDLSYLPFRSKILLPCVTRWDHLNSQVTRGENQESKAVRITLLVRQAPTGSVQKIYQLLSNYFKRYWSFERRRFYYPILQRKINKKLGEWRVLVLVWDMANWLSLYIYQVSSSLSGSEFEFCSGQRGRPLNGRTNGWVADNTVKFQY